MARLKIGDRVRVNLAFTSIADKTGIITGYAQMQHAVWGQCYSVPNWKVQLDNGEYISINEKYLLRDEKRRK